MMDTASVVKAADTSLRVLQRIAFADQPMGVTQIANDIGIAKGAIFKHLRTLLDHGMIVQDPHTSHYRPGPKLWLMGQNVNSSQALTEIAMPLMHEVRDLLGLAVVLSVPTPHSAFVLATLPSNQSIEIGVRPGSELSLHSSAQGKVLLAFGADNLIAELPELLPSITPHTETSRTALLQEIEKIRKQGYAVAHEQSLLGISALSAPIHGSNGLLIGSIGLIGSVQFLGKEPTAEQLAALLALTRDIGRRAS